MPEVEILKAQNRVTIQEWLLAYKFIDQDRNENLWFRKLLSVYDHQKKVYKTYYDGQYVCTESTDKELQIQQRMADEYVLVSETTGNYKILIR